MANGVCIQGAINPSAASPNKKDPNAPQPTPLEKMLQNAGPIREDGSDKFFGMENVSFPLAKAGADGRAADQSFQFGNTW
jgi:ubiquitin carboxyl-terminal hydrolase 9/13